MDFVYFLGRLHVLALHLPIGIICVVILMEFLGRSERFKNLLLAADYLWLAATVSAFATVALGMMHRTEGGFEGPSMASHAFWGIGTAFCCLGILLFRRLDAHGYARRQPILAILMLITVTMTGHYGGNLTHGSTYLLTYAPNPFQTLADIEARPPVTDITQADVFLDVVNPLLQLRCASCHNNDKFRGQLSLASYDLMLLGGESGPALVPGSIVESEILQRITLTSNHDDFMPADGKTPLTTEQASLISWWVEQGAPEKALLISLNPQSDILATATEYLNLGAVTENNF